MRTTLSGIKVIAVLVIVMVTSGQLIAQTSRQTQRKIKHKSDSLAREVEKQGSSVIRSVKETVPDSVPSLKKEAKKVLPARPDSIGVSYENGKWNLPKGQRPSTDVLNQKDLAKPVEDAVKNVSGPDLKNVTD